MPYLVDASNLGGALGGERGARAAEAVVDYLQRWAAGRGSVVAVFDGEPQTRVAERYGPLEIAWSGAGRTADALIERRARVAPKETIVVTNDRELARRCRDLGARVEPVTFLRERIERPRRSGRSATVGSDKPEPSVAEREHWRQVFERKGD
jgi:predicted RNA-binding protein with PIN domain